MTTFTRPALAAVMTAALMLLSACGLYSNTAGLTSSEGPDGTVTTLQVGLFGALSDAGLILAKDEGCFSAQHIFVQFVTSQSAPTIIGLLASGNLAAAGTSATPGLFNAIGDGVPVKIAADKGQIDATHSWTGLVVRTGGPASVAALRGKKIALPSIETSTGAELSQALGTAGLTTKDVTLVPGSAADNFSAFMSGAVSAAALQEPFISQALASGQAKVLVPFGKTMPDAENGILLFGSALAGNTLLAKRFLAAYLKGVAAYNAAFPASGKPVGRAEVVKDLIANTAVKKPKLYDTMQPVLFSPGGAVNTASIDYFQRFFVSLGLQKKVVPPSQYLLTTG
jgi:NitT/TauT family transport system substrate-binding protein